MVVERCPVNTLLDDDISFCGDVFRAEAVPLR